MLRPWLRHCQQCEMVSVHMAQRQAVDGWRPYYCAREPPAGATPAPRPAVGLALQACRLPIAKLLLWISRLRLCRCGSGDQRRPRVCVHAMPLPAHTLPAPIAVSVVGPPRSDPHLKHSLWATQRCVRGCKRRAQRAVSPVVPASTPCSHLHPGQFIARMRCWITIPAESFLLWARTSALQCHLT